MQDVPVCNRVFYIVELVGCPPLSFVGFSSWHNVALLVARSKLLQHRVGRDGRPWLVKWGWSVTPKDMNRFATKRAPNAFCNVPLWDMYIYIYYIPG